MNGRTLTGCGTALVTPFTRDGKVDEPGLRSFVEWQVAEGIHFVVPCGSTGEAVTMTPAEHRRVVEITVEAVAGRVPVVAGAGRAMTDLCSRTWRLEYYGNRGGSRCAVTLDASSAPTGVRSSQSLPPSVWRMSRPP